MLKNNVETKNKIFEELKEALIKRDTPKVTDIHFDKGGVSYTIEIPLSFFLV